MSSNKETKLNILQSVSNNLGLSSVQFKVHNRVDEVPHIEYVESNKLYIVHLPEDFYIVDGMHEIGKIYLGINKHPLFITASIANKSNFTDRFEGEAIRAVNYTNDLFVALFFMMRYSEYPKVATKFALSRLYALQNGHSMYPSVLNERDYSIFLHIYIALVLGEAYSDSVYKILETLEEPNLDNIKKVALSLFDLDIDYNDKENTLKLCRRTATKTIELDGIHV
jgi:hypothetical protein